MPGPFPVKKPGTFNVLTSAGGQTGDGKGSENAVPVRGANQVVLLLDVDDTGAAASKVEIFMEISINGTDYYRQTDIPTGATPAVTRRKYTVSNSDVTGAERWAIALDVLAAYARFNFGLDAAATWGNLACRAITGRV